jgi:hypothetical protein
MLRQRLPVQDPLEDAVLAEDDDEDDDAKLSASRTTLGEPPDFAVAADCPLMDGSYFLLPRAWCHGWRRYMRTGQTSEESTGPPHAGDILCACHGAPLLPPHVDLYLAGIASQLLESTTTSLPSQQDATAGGATGMMIPGQGPDEAAIQALRAAGLSDTEVHIQLAAMRSIELQRQQRVVQPPAPVHNHNTAANATPKNELLDRENHVVVEIVTHAEFAALANLYAGNNSYGISFVVSHGRAVFETSACRKCDATGRQCQVTLRNRAVRNLKKCHNNNNNNNHAASATATTAVSGNSSLSASAAAVNSGSNSSTNEAGRPARAGAVVEY